MGIIIDKKNSNYISASEYKYLLPHNNFFSKWLEDIPTSERVLYKHSKHFNKTYFSIIRRDRSFLILKNGDENREYSYKDIVSLLKEKGELELRPAVWNSKKDKYFLKYQGDTFFINEKEQSNERLHEIIKELICNYVVIEKLHADKYIKLYIANGKKGSTILGAYYNSNEESEALPVDLNDGKYHEDKPIVIPEWDKIIQEIKLIAKDLDQLTFFSVSISLIEGSFKIINFNDSPKLPEGKISECLNNYLKQRYKSKKKNRINKNKVKPTIKKAIIFFADKLLMLFARKGIRPYMQRLWVRSVLNDFLSSKGSIKRKVWAWNRGFLSFRIHQYGLNNDNYKEFLSDYDYHWLNRINNEYQKWINDKTTFRYVMEPFKKHLPDYYFSICKKNNELSITKMPDCPDMYTKDFDGIFKLLEDKRKLALKSSRGTHGDGFYCLLFDNNKYYINDKEMTKMQIINFISGFKSPYIVTEFIEMNTQLKKIYSKSVNSIRVMVINRNGYNPKIMQTYMRIGSSKTGYTDNIGYGGVCVNIDMDSGEMYKPEILVNHFYEDCEFHKDTGVKIEGVIPNWEIIKKGVFNICRWMPELEYLGFDIAVTDDSFKIIEINIHQDLHKVAHYSTEIKEFFKEKISMKKEQCNIK